jgi:peptidylprolyl isomerase
MIKSRTALAPVLIAAAIVLGACGNKAKVDPSTAAPSGPAPSTSAVTPTPAAPDKGGNPKDMKIKPRVDIPKGKAPTKLVAQDIVKGKGKVARKGDDVEVQYVGVLYDGGTEFDSSWTSGQPFPFTVGNGDVIPGWDKGVPGMRVGGRRKLIIPASLAYGAQGQPPTIPPNATLVFVVDLLKIK